MENCYLYMHETRFYNHLFKINNANINNMRVLSNYKDELLNELNKIKVDFNKLINDLAWWIPIRKWRDNFRSKMLNI
ncbi:hypothetical protein EPJ70_08225 [Brachyspira aalborgi]|uniref:Uncharacterized protein n=2 Tax=Brachyspira aalborgi TaxID=29522 RepID=A0A5C8F3F6_9SPIR|nr:hypothetical protein EPJ70_08225 [Brachyspira aalborgi]